MAKFGVGKTVGTLGDYLREQRMAASLSLRQLAEQTGISNPYLSQIERGLRRPSAEVLQQLAKGLRISAIRTVEQVATEEGLSLSHDTDGNRLNHGGTSGWCRASHTLAPGRHRAGGCELLKAIRSKSISPR